MLSVKQGGIKYHFLSVWYDSTWDWTQVSRAIGEHSNHHAIKKKSTWLGWEGDSLGIVQDVENWLYFQMIYTETGICPEEWDAQNYLGFWTQVSQAIGEHSNH